MNCPACKAQLVGVMPSEAEMVKSALKLLMKINDTGAMIKLGCDSIEKFSLFQMATVVEWLGDNTRVRALVLPQKRTYMINSPWTRDEMIGYNAAIDEIARQLKGDGE